LHAVVALVDGAIIKQDAIRRSALMNTELEMAEAVQRSVFADNKIVKTASHVALHYEAASRLGGDWFYFFEHPSHDRVSIIIGDVTGQGLTQGLVTTAVKGALDVLKELAKHGADLGGPAAVVTLLESVVRRVAGANGLVMTCLAVAIDFETREMKVCNAGHTFPILVRAASGDNEVSHLHKNQQPLLGHDATHRYTDTAYELKPRDALVIYSDGLSDARTFKSAIFGRLLFRALREPRGDRDAEGIKAEILSMFRYYTQERRIEDDVCFLVVQIPDATSVHRRGDVA
jgi:serine phosphatase RsbU (regulator of sigma subunit)